ncbi:hypothetical protein IWZ03DRAFT_11184 [Phyllosticta citriasiana]|uniref:Secreted protein n=1 Tax=Phyllosticta citriasiana TaxID=595635 RepID=A0ABR1KZN3_9PEZI
MFNVAALAACMRLYVWCVHECAVQPATTTSASRSVCCDGAWERGGGGGGEVPGFGDELKRGDFAAGNAGENGRRFDKGPAGPRLDGVPTGEQHNGPVR